MRQWTVNPSVLCRMHILGEHVEHHMFLGSIVKKISLTGYILNNLIEPKSLLIRHNLLVEEMLRRGFNHKSDLLFEESMLDYLPINEQEYKLDIDRAIQDLISRCPECRQNQEGL